MTREEAQKAVKDVLGCLEFNRMAMVVHLSAADCAGMYEQLLSVQKYLQEPQEPRLRRLAQEWNAFMQDAALGGASYPEATVTIRAEQLQLLCDAVLAFTTESES